MTTATKGLEILVTLGEKPVTDVMHLSSGALSAALTAPVRDYISGPAIPPPGGALVFCEELWVLPPSP